jgi:hypothetical protein
VDSIETELMYSLTQETAEKAQAREKGSSGWRVWGKAL